jgi:poly(beta-D-mannuronate) lyase
MLEMRKFKSLKQRQYRFFLAILILIFGNLEATAENYRITNASELIALKLLPGDQVILSGSSWQNQQLIFKAKGSADKPIILRSESPGKLICTGNSTLKIDGEWLVVDGLAFASGYSEQGDVITFSKTSTNCRLTNTSILNYNHPNKTKDYKWVSVYGTRNRVDHCAFTGKTHQGTTLVVWLSETPNYHKIDHNYFGPRPDLGVNGGETIRIGTSDWSMHASYTQVEYNIFDKCNGETEIISIKSGHNLISNNLFYECVGTLTFRHGNSSEVAHNFFIGNKVKNTGGIRIIGEQQNVHDNYLQGLTGTDLRAAVSIMNAFEKAKLNEYWQVKNAIVKNNIIVDCATAFVVGAGKNELRVLAPKRVSIIDNYIISPGVLIDQKDTPLESIVKNNQVKGTSLEDGFIALSVPVSKNSNNLFQIGEMPLQTFWTTEKIGPVWFKVGYFKWRVVD